DHFGGDTSRGKPSKQLCLGPFCGRFVVRLDIGSLARWNIGRRPLLAKASCPAAVMAVPGSTSDMHAERAIGLVLSISVASGTMRLELPGCPSARVDSGLVPSCESFSHYYPTYTGPVGLLFSPAPFRPSRPLIPFTYQSKSQAFRLPIFVLTLAHSVAHR